MTPEEREATDAGETYAALDQLRDARTLLMWVSDCWQDGELRPDFDDCVDAIRDFLWERNVK